MYTETTSVRSRYAPTHRPVSIVTTAWSASTSLIAELPATSTAVRLVCTLSKRCRKRGLDKCRLRSPVSMTTYTMKVPAVADEGLLLLQQYRSPYWLRSWMCCWSASSQASIATHPHRVLSLPHDTVSIHFVLLAGVMVVGAWGTHEGLLYVHAFNQFEGSGDGRGSRATVRRSSTMAHTFTPSKVSTIH